MNIEYIGIFYSADFLLNTFVGTIIATHTHAGVTHILFFNRIINIIRKERK